MANTETSRFEEVISNLQSVVEQVKGSIFYFSCVSLCAIQMKLDVTCARVLC